MVDTINRERAAFVRKYFDAEWPCRRLYHLMLNSDHGIEHATNVILSTMESLEHQRQDGTSRQRRTISNRVQQPVQLEFVFVSQRKTAPF